MKHVYEVALEPQRTPFLSHVAQAGAAAGSGDAGRGFPTYDDVCRQVPREEPRIERLIEQRIHRPIAVEPSASPMHRKVGAR